MVLLAIPGYCWLLPGAVSRKRRSQEEPGRARRKQEEAGGVRRKQEEAGIAKRSQVELEGVIPSHL